MAEYHTSPSRTICFHTLCALPPPPLLSSNLRYMSMHISHFLALSSSLSPQTFEFSTSHIIVDFTYCCTALRTRTRTNTNPNGTEASAAGRSGNARAMRKQSKCRMIQEGEGHWPNSSENLQKARYSWVLRTPQTARLHVVVCIFEGGLFYSLPLRERGRSSCPVKAFYGSGAEQ